jgi:hypothetical protein
MGARIKATLRRFMRVGSPLELDIQVGFGVSGAGIASRDARRVNHLPPYRELLAEFVLPTSPDAVARSPHWQRMFDEPIKAVLQKLKRQGLLVEPNNPRARICHDRDESDLRMLCIENGLQPTGGAADLIDRLLTIDPSGWLLGYPRELLQCSEFADHLAAPRVGMNTPSLELDLADLITQGDFDAQRDLLQDRIGSGLSEDDATWRMLKGRAQQAAHAGNLALCRIVHLGMAHHLIRRNKKMQAFQALCIVCIFDLCGARNRGDVPPQMRATYSHFDVDRPSLALSLVRRMGDLSGEMMLTMNEVREIFISVAICVKVPISRLRLWKVLQLALEGALDCEEGTCGNQIIRDLLE